MAFVIKNTINRKYYAEGRRQVLDVKDAVRYETFMEAKKQAWQLPICHFWTIEERPQDDDCRVVEKA